MWHKITTYTVSLLDSLLRFDSQEEGSLVTFLVPVILSLLFNPFSKTEYSVRNASRFYLRDSCDIMCHVLHETARLLSNYMSFWQF